MTVGRSPDDCGVDLGKTVVFERINTYERLLHTAGHDPSIARHRAVTLHTAFVGYHSLITTNPEYADNADYVETLHTLFEPT